MRPLINSTLVVAIYLLVILAVLITVALLCGVIGVLTHTQEVISVSFVFARIFMEMIAILIVLSVILESIRATM